MQSSVGYFFSFVWSSFSCVGWLWLSAQGHLCILVFWPTFRRGCWAPGLSGAFRKENTIKDAVDKGTQTFFAVFFGSDDNQISFLF